MADMLYAVSQNDLSGRRQIVFNSDAKTGFRQST